jgi:hypothetical protein
MKQAGLYKLTLYENKDLQVVYNSLGQVQSVSTSGSTTVISEEAKPKYNLNLSEAANNDLLASHSFEFLNYDLDNEILNVQLSTSIYGFIPVYELNDGKKYIILSPFFASIGDLDSQVSHSWPVTLTPRIDINNVDIKEVE